MRMTATTSNILSLVATKSFALYAAEKGSQKEKYLIEKAKV